MRVSFEVMSVRPLGERLSGLTAILAGSELTNPVEMNLSSRGDRSDLSVGEILESAARSPFDRLRIRTSHGLVEAYWSYGLRAGIQTLSGTLFVDDKGNVEALKHTFLECCGWCRAVYGYCDRKRVVDADMTASGGRLFSPESLYGIYWMNCFGAEYDVPEDKLREVTGIDRGPFGQRFMALSTHPSTRDEELATRIAARWPVFRKYGPVSVMRPVQLDWTELRSRRGAESRVASLTSVVGDVTSFLDNIQGHAESFRSWAATRGLPIETEDEMRGTLYAARHVLEDTPGLLVAAIAAYGEAVRRDSGGEWRKSLLGELEVGHRWTPWRSRRVVLEVLEALHLKG